MILIRNSARSYVDWWMIMGYLVGPVHYRWMIAAGGEKKACFSSLDSIFPPCSGQPGQMVMCLLQTTVVWDWFGLQLRQEVKLWTIVTYCPYANAIVAGHTWSNSKEIPELSCSILRYGVATVNSVLLLCLRGTWCVWCSGRVSHGFPMKLAGRWLEACSSSNVTCRRFAGHFSLQGAYHSAQGLRMLEMCRRGFQTALPTESTQLLPNSSWFEGKNIFWKGQVGPSSHLQTHVPSNSISAAEKRN